MTYWQKRILFGFLFIIIIYLGINGLNVEKMKLFDFFTIKLCSMYIV